MLFQDRFEGGPLLPSRLADVPDPAAIVELTLLRAAVPVGYELASTLVVRLPRRECRTRYFSARLSSEFGVLIQVASSRSKTRPATTGAQVAMGSRRLGAGLSLEV